MGYDLVEKKKVLCHAVMPYKTKYQPTQREFSTIRKVYEWWASTSIATPYNT